MLVADKTEKFVLDQRATKSATNIVAMKFRILLIGGDVGISLEKEGSCVDPVGTTMDVAWPWIVLVPEAVLMSMCAPLVEPCWASYMDVFTRNSSMDSGAGVGSA